MSKKTGKAKKTKAIKPLTDADRFKRIVRGVSVDVVEFVGRANRFEVEITGTIAFIEPRDFKTRPEALAVAKEWRAFFKRMREGVYTADPKKLAELMVAPLVKRNKQNSTEERVKRAKTRRL